MRIKLFSAALIAAAALFTASCNSDDALVQNPASGETVGIPALNVSVGENSRAGFTSEKGGWTNFWADANGVKEKFDYRVIVQIFAKGNTSAPIAQVRKMVKVAETDAAPADNKIAIEDLRLPVGNSYRAVAWVDFVNKDAGDEDLYYNTQNLSSVSMTGIVPEMTTQQKTRYAEMRDCYTGTLDFTIDNDGVVTNSTELNILAKRPLAKVRVVLTDYKSIDAWKTYFSGQDANRVMNAAAMKVKDMSTGFNAYTSEPVQSSDSYAFTSDFTYSAGTDCSIKWITTPLTAGELDFATLKATSIDELPAVADPTLAYLPVLDFNYFIPASNEASAVYDMSFQALSKNDKTEYTWTPGVTQEETETTGWRVLAERNINSVPVKRNCLTTIWGNFLTKAYGFTVTVNDEFDNEVNKVVLDDDNTVKSEFFVDGVPVQVERDAANNIVSIKIDYKVDKLTAENYDNVFAQVNKIAGNWTDKTEIFIYPDDYMKSVDDGIIVNHKGRIHIYPEATSLDSYSVSGLKNVLIYGTTMAQLGDISISSTTTVYAVAMGEGTSFSNLTISTDGDAYIAGKTEGDVKVDAAKAIFMDYTAKDVVIASKHYGNVTINKNKTTGVAYLVGGKFSNDVDVYSNLAINGCEGKNINLFTNGTEVDVNTATLGFAQLAVGMSSGVHDGGINLYAVDFTAISGKYNSTAFAKITTPTLPAWNE
jgi:hypothetical protein